MSKTFEFKQQDLIFTIILLTVIYIATFFFVSLFSGLNQFDHGYQKGLLAGELKCLKEQQNDQD